jgi:hypothetical protein
MSLGCSYWGTPDIRKYVSDYRPSLDSELLGFDHLSIGRVKVIRTGAG